MSSERQIQSARENGRKSRGPVTPEGKARSARNADRHGLCAKALLLDQESADCFNKIVRGLYDEFRPETASEVATVEVMAIARWRQRRVWTMEQCAINNEIRNAGPEHHAVPDPCTRAALAVMNLSDRSHTLALFARYDTAYDNQFNRALRRLNAIRDLRRKTETAKRTEQLFENKGPVSEAEPKTNPF